jgi:hypothetical protein
METGYFMYDLNENEKFKFVVQIFAAWGFGLSNIIHPLYFMWEHGERLLHMAGYVTPMLYMDLS